MVEYILFLDETKKNKNNPYFCVAGFSITRENYEKILIPSINSFKKRYFGGTDVVFHLTEMKKSEKEFGILKDGTLRTVFWQELHSILKGMQLTTFGCYFDSEMIKKLYPNRSTSEYDLALHYIVENYIHQMRYVNGVGSISIESRTLKENQKLQTILDQ